ncbi:MAG TPA: FAD-binding oxidoreductase [Candidatus Saccharimonadales bacterium]|nr:FAD-binding oxidoreductase [Candidatus Saccharimonadales bacterium]
MDEVKIKRLRDHFSGQIILPNDEQYKAVQNTIVAKGSPGIVLQPKTIADIAAAIKFGVENTLILSVRSGGHSVAGFSTNDGGLVIDLSNFNDVEVVDQDKGLVKIGAGAKWIDVATTLNKHGLALSSGDTKTVGVGGLTVGGGIGWMVRKYGLAIDSLVAAEVVTADGKTLRASKTENPELFWAIRGGGGNFGIVIHLEFVAHKVNKVYAGIIMFSLDDVGGLLKNWRDYMRSADEALSIIINILPTFMGNPPMFMMMCCYASSDKKAAAKVVQELKALGTVLNEDVKEKDYVDVLEDAHPPEGVKIIVNNVLVEEFTDEAIDAIVKAREKKPDLILQIRPLGGAVSKVAPNATAFAYRNSEVLLVSPTFVPPDASDAEVNQALKAWRLIAQFGKGAYSGFMSTATESDLEELYPKDTYDRLVKAKQQYDPQNIFKQTYNIKP